MASLHNILRRIPFPVPGKNGPHKAPSATAPIYPLDITINDPLMEPWGTGSVLNLMAKWQEGEGIWG